MRPAQVAVGASVAVLATVLGAQTPTPVASPQTFRAATDVVMVDVAVRSGGRMVEGLTAADFVLTDNGVRQQIENLDSGAVPVDVTLITDVSGNPRRPWVPRRKPDTAAIAIRNELKQMAEVLRADDRVRLLAIDRYAHQVWPLVTAGSVPAVPRVPFDGLAAVYDTMATALMLPAAPARRHVVIARTKGMDTVSAIQPERLAAVANTSDALFHLVIMEAEMDTEEELARFQADPNHMGLAWPTNRSWVPRRGRMVGPNPTHVITPEGGVVRAAVEGTGGAWHQTTGLSEPSLMGTFRRTIENFRQSYVLRYTPRGVPRAGWHTIKVTVPRIRDARITARRGYAVDDRPPAPPPAPIPAVPRSIAELTLAYERGAYEQFVAGLRQVSEPERLLNQFTLGGNPWPGAPRREATMAIELAEMTLFSPRPPVREKAAAVLTRFSNLIRQPLQPDVFELFWHFATLTLLQGALRPDDAEQFITRAIARFPDEPRFHLARAIAAEQRLRSRNRDGVLTAVQQQDLSQATSLYEAAARRMETAAEANIRLAFLLHQRGSDAEALARLDMAGPGSDMAMAFLQSLFRGHVLAGLGRDDDSLAAYRAALAMMPRAQSARVALMNALYRKGARLEAEALAEQVQAEPSVFNDPWWSYWQGQYRFYPLVMARLREMSK